MSTRQQQPIVQKADELLKRARKAGDSRLLQAIRRWRRMSREEQKRLVREIVDARAVELRRAYPTVRGIASGLRTKTQGGDRVITREPCVVLMVGRKWTKQPKTKAALARELPKYLWAHATDPRSGERGLCAVPVDIESGIEYRISPHSTSFVLAVRSPMPRQRGVVTCAVEMPPGFGGTHVVSCHHVLAMSKVTAPPGSAAAGVRIHVRQTGGRTGMEVGRLSPFRGRLVRPSAGLSFDAALARITDASAFRQVTPSPTPTRAITTVEDIPFSLRIVTPRDTTRAVFVQAWSNFDRIHYLTGSSQPVHPVVIECQVLGAMLPKPGDSGSPVLNRKMDTLVGMHIAGSGRRAFFLPACNVLDGKYYGLGSPLTLVA